MKVVRLLPAIIITATLLLCVKLIATIQDTKSIFISSVEAETAPKTPNVSAEKPKDIPDQGKSAKKDDKKPDEKKSDDKKSADKDKKEEKKGEEKKPEGEAGKEGGEKKDKDKENPNVSKELESTTEQRYTAVEVELLQNLSKRREELERWENNIQIKEAALDATQKRIEDKIKQVEVMKKQVSILLAQYNAKEDAKINSLVKIYENMKPAEAARIFEEIEMPILLLVVDAMSEKKAAPILAAMNPKKAKQLTVELANERRLNSKTIVSAGSVADLAPQAGETETTSSAGNSTSAAENKQ